MTQRILATVLNGLGAVFPEFRARPARAYICNCLPMWTACNKSCNHNPTCLAQCYQDYENCIAGCGP